MPHFADSLANAVQEKGSSLVVGLDPRWGQLPAELTVDAGSEPSLQAQADAYQRFSMGVIDAVAETVAVVKPQMAFFEELGPAGMAALAEVVRYAQQRGLLVVLDGKRNDIGSTATAYARGLLGRDSPWGGDALTISPYLGDDSLEPFVDTAGERGAGLFVLVKTSNPGGAMLQDRVLVDRVVSDRADNDMPLYRLVADHVESLAASSVGERGYGSVGAVVGATYPEQLAELRSAMPHTWFLVPGFGAQGGSAADVAGAFDERGLGAIVNSSRGVIFAHRRPEYAQFGEARWQDAVRQAAIDATAQIRDAAATR